MSEHFYDSSGSAIIAQYGIGASMISREDVYHMARLARILLSDVELERFRKDLSGILNFVAELKAVDTTTVEPLTGGTNLEHVTRPDDRDTPLGGKHGPSLVDAAPSTRNGYVVARAVFENRERP